MFSVIAITFNVVQIEFGKTFPKYVKFCLAFIAVASGK